MMLQDAAADEFGHLRDHAVAEATQFVSPIRRGLADARDHTSSQPGGNPCNHSIHSGFRVIRRVDAPLASEALVSPASEFGSGVFAEDAASTILRLAVPFFAIDGAAWFPFAVGVGQCRLITDLRPSVIATASS